MATVLAGLGDVPGVGVSMVSIQAARSILIVILVVGAISAAGPGATYGLFTDSKEATGEVIIDTAFNQGNGGGDPGPKGPKAYDDANGNGVYDKQSEAKYNANKLDDFDDPSANLVIPSDVGTISNNNGISMTANSIESSVDIDGGNGDVVFNTTGGGVDLGGQSVISDANEVTINAAGDVDLSGASVSAQTDGVNVTTVGVLNVDDASITVTGNPDVELRAMEISARYATIEPQNGATVVSATRNGGGELDATGANMSGGNGGITLESDGTVRLNDSTLTSQNGQATVDLGTSTATLYVDGTNVNEKDLILEYDPDGVTVVGTPNGGTST